MPDSGVFNFTTVNIPAGVTITFNRNATNKPLTILAIGDVVIAGTIILMASRLTRMAMVDLAGPVDSTVAREGTDSINHSLVSPEMVLAAAEEE